MKVHKGNYRRKVRNSDCGIMTPQNNLASKVILFFEEYNIDFFIFFEHMKIY